MNFLHEVQVMAAVWPDKIALARGGGRVVTYGQLVSGSHAATAFLTRAGVHATDVVSVEVDDPIRRILLVLALCSKGICLVNSAGATEGRVPETTVVLIDKAPSPSLPSRVRFVGVDDNWFLGDGGSPALQVPFRAGAPAIVWFTSGTTGRPKPMALSWSRLLAKLAIRKSILTATNFDRVLVLPALTASYGMMTTLACLALGKSVFLVDYATDSFKVISLFHIDYVVVSTYQLAKITEGAKTSPHDLTGLQGVLFAGGAASTNLIADALTYMTSNLMNTYASTEAGEAAFGRACLDREPGFVGHLAPWAEVEIISEQGDRLKPGAEGRVRLRTVCMAKPFVGASIDYDGPDDWLIPGDIGRLDVKGRLTVTGRDSDLINLGGVKLAPDVLEDIVLMIPGVEDVAVLGALRAGESSETLHFFIAAQPAAWESIVRACSEKLPKEIAIELHHTAKLPRTNLGKIERTALRNLLMDDAEVGR